MKSLTVITIFPNAQQPDHGLFGGVQPTGWFRKITMGQN
jgi:hypothetical protein